jgi:hypothetical protein
VWTDNETTADLLGFRVHADLVRSVVLDKTILPVTIGIFGDWGGGKTSILRMLEQDLDPDRWEGNAEEKARCEKVACLYINGWLFEGYDDAKSALLTAVLLALGEHKRFGPKVRGKVVSLLKSVNWMRVARLGFKEVAMPAVAAYVTGGASFLPAAGAAIGKLTGGLIGGPEAGKETEKDEGATKADGIDWESLIKTDGSASSPLDVRTFRDRFAKMLAESDMETLVVLIDDLDRCAPDRIIDNLEAIKLFLNVPGTAFVIGADPRIVRRAIAHRYGVEAPAIGQNEDEAGDRLVTDYLEKLIQVPYSLPRLSPAETETYMTLLFCGRHLDPADFRKCLGAADAQRAESRYGVFGLAAVRAAIAPTGPPVGLTDSLAFSTKVAPLVTEGLKGNPRQVKRFLNAFILRKQLARVARLDHLRDDVLVKLMVLEYAQSDRFRDLYNWQAAQGGYPSQLKDMETAWRGAEPGATSPAIDPAWGGRELLKKWVRVDPPLSEVDLGDYFWVARDKLASSLSGVALIPPVIRRVLDDLLSGNQGRMTLGAAAGVALAQDDRTTLVDALSRHLGRHPEEAFGFNAIRALVEGGFPGAVEAIAAAAPSIATDKVPAAVGINLRALLPAHPAVESSLKPVLDEWAKTDTMVGRALAPRPTRGR